MYVLPIKYIVQLFFVYIFIVEYTTSFPFGDKNQSEIITSEGLYNSSDNVVVLNSSNLKKTIYGSKNAWVVEFYNSWCGHCQRFAPVWKSLARDIKPWRDIVNVAAIDCVSDENSPVCKKYETIFYPMLKYFSPNSKSDALGVEVEHTKMKDVVKNNILQELQKDQQAGIGTAWPNITPYRGSESEDIWKGVSTNIIYKFLLFEETDSYLGTEVILDFHNITEILIRRVTSDNQMLCMNYQVTDFPSLFAIDRDGARTNLKIITPTRFGVMQLINNFIKPKGLAIDMSNFDVYDATDESDKLKKSQSIDTVKETDDNIDQTDLESALRYSLEHEIPMQKNIDDSKLIALKKYLSVLAEYFPLKHDKSDYFITILNALDNSDSISGEDFYKLVKLTGENKSPIYSTSQQWVRCKGSNPRLRGYPCGLWTLFHTLTANYAASNTQDTSLHVPTKILSAMYGYIKNFFGCADCSDHFVSMADRLKLTRVKSADESILWLWQAHNEVNERLSGDLTEDPQFPKIQYPSKKHCPSCRKSNDEWDLNEVLNYLKKKYTLPHIESNNASPPQYLKLIRTELPINKNMTHQQKINWDFTLFDISICVVLYVTSAIILTLVCIKFLVKRTSKKKIQVHNFFLRV